MSELQKHLKIVSYLIKFTLKLGIDTNAIQLNPFPRQTSEVFDDELDLAEEKEKLADVTKVLRKIRTQLLKAGKRMNTLATRRNKVQHVLRWSNPFFLMGGYQKVLRKYFNSYPDGRPYYGKANYGIINDPDYCEIVDFYNIAHPENMFKEMNFFTDYAKNGTF